MSPEVVEVIVTGPDAGWLAEFIGGLIADRTIACGNIVGPIRSLYRWKGVVEDQPEFRATLHTRASQVLTIVERANRDHPYEVPCVVATSIVAGNPAYLAWVMAETIDPTA